MNDVSISLRILSARVFVLSTGRCGSLTFTKACEYLTNYSAAHESLASGYLFDERFNYPDNHIEVDNRLSWFLGELAIRFDNEDTFYVHLIRDPEAVAHSFLQRWDSGWSGGIIGAFAQGILMTGYEWEPDRRIEACRFYVESVNRNIAEFVQGRQSTVVTLEAAQEEFPLFLERIDAQGDLEGALREWDTRHNQSTRDPE